MIEIAYKKNMWISRCYRPIKTCYKSQEIQKQLPSNLIDKEIYSVFNLKLVMRASIPSALLLCNFLFSLLHCISHSPGCRFCRIFDCRFTRSNRLLCSLSHPLFWPFFVHFFFNPRPETEISSSSSVIYLLIEIPLNDFCNNAYRYLATKLKQTNFTCLRIKFHVLFDHNK